MPAYIDHVIVQAFIRETDEQGNDVLIRSDQGELALQIPQRPEIVPVRGRSAAKELGRVVREIEKRIKES